MTSKDKTRQQLVDSMRKTKETASGKSSTPARAPASVSRQAKGGAGRTSTRAASAESRRGQPGPAASGQDPYQCGRRVWPD